VEDNVQINRRGWRYITFSYFNGIISSSPIFNGINSIASISVVPMALV